MKRFIIKILVLFFLMGLTDIVLGSFFDYSLKKATMTDFGRDNHISNVGQEDLLVFGSSRAVHHYNSHILKDSLGIDCYNCGEDGQGIILNYGRLLMEKQRHTPKIVIYDVQSEYDVEQDDNTKYLKWLRPHYEKKGISEIIKSVDKKEAWKSLSRLYRYNSEYLLLLIALVHSNEETNDMGFFPLDGQMDTTKVGNRKADLSNDIKTDSLKLYYLREFIKELGGQRLYFVVSPTWYGKTNNYETIKQLCKEHQIPFIDFSDNPKYIHQNKFFKDGMHLNKLGADEFTKDLVVRLKEK